MTRSKKRKSLKWIGLLIYPFFIWFSPIQGHCQDQLNQAYKHALDLEFDKSRALLDHSASSEIPFFDVYVENLNEILELFFSENDSMYEAFSSNERERLKELGNAEEDNPYLMFFESEIKIQWAFIKLKFGKQWSAAWSLRSAYKIIKRNIKKYPDFKLNQKSLGLIHIIFGAVPAKHQWLLGLFGLEGDVMLGLDELTEIASDESNIFSTEARLISSIVYSYLLENNVQALQNLKFQKKDHSLTEAYVSALALMKAHRAEEARSVLIQTQSNQPLFNYMIAETHFQEGNYDQANQLYQSFLSSFKGKNNVKDAYFKKSLCYLFLGDQKNYIQAKEKAILFGKDYSEVDKNAADLLEKSQGVNQFLIKLRYAIDGGYYNRADSIVRKINAIKLSHYESIEFNYRKARLHHLTGMMEAAISEYVEIFKSHNLIPENYFAPNSLLQLGYIYMERGEFDKATMYLNQVLKFRKHPYKTSLDSKARIALDKIKK